MTRLPEPFFPLHDSEIKKLAKLDILQSGPAGYTYPAVSVFTKAGNRMGTARRCNLARLFLTLQRHQLGWGLLANTHVEVAQILIRVSDSIITSLAHLNLFTKSTDLITRPRFTAHFCAIITSADRIIEKSSEDPLVLPDECIEELRRAGLLK